MNTCVLGSGLLTEEGKRRDGAQKWGSARVSYMRICPSLLRATAVPHSLKDRGLEQKTGSRQ